MSEKEELEKIRPGLYEDVKQLNADAKVGRKISGKTLRKIFVNWMVLAGMSTDVANAIEARHNSDTSKTSYLDFAKTQGKLQYPKAIKLLENQFPIPKWVENYEGNEKWESTAEREAREKEEIPQIVEMLKRGASNEEIKAAGFKMGRDRIAKLAKDHNIVRNEGQKKGGHMSKRKAATTNVKSKVKHKVSKDILKMAKT